MPDIRSKTKHQRHTCLIQNGAVFLLARRSIHAARYQARRIALAPLARKGLWSRHACSHSLDCCKQCISVYKIQCSHDIYPQFPGDGACSYLSCDRARIPRTIQQYPLESCRWNPRLRIHCCDYSTLLCQPRAECDELLMVTLLGCWR